MDGWPDRSEGSSARSRDEAGRRRAPDTASIAQVEIDPEAARRNLKATVATSGRPALCVVKADAYGHGAESIAQALESEPSCRGFAVARMEEATQLRPALRSKRPILCFGTFLAARAESERRDILRTSNEQGLEPVLSSVDDVDALVAMPAEIRQGTAAHLAVNTGMAREGLQPEELARALERLAQAGITPQSIWTHFASSEEPEAEATEEQLESFAGALESLRGNQAVPPVHLENSAAALHRLGDRLPLPLRGRVGAIRIGGALFGLDLRAGDHEPALEPVMRVTTHLVQLRRIPRGQAVGYGGSWVAPRDSVIGLAAMGYADGLRSPPPDFVWHGAERSARVPVVGRVSMDLVTVDLTDVFEAGGGSAPCVGDRMVVLGASRGLRVDARAHAEAAGVVDYAVTVGFALRLPRRILSSPSSGTAEP